MKEALLIIDHGSKFSEANDMIEDVANVVRSLKPNLIVEVAHMELASPDIQAGFQKCVEKGAQRVIAHPYMLAPGRHATTDIPRLVQQAAAAYPDIEFRVTQPLGVHRNIAEIILERAEIN